ncbi:MAG: CDP-alcohol phosphatidyltransferase family protein [Thiotrichales bacterium]|nr:CDP-alcohol phosphatidyltransferase family protein [Thiotrichales bacterium]
MVGDSWTHKLARLCIRPLVDTPVTPNHLTAVRLASGLLACGAFAVGSYLMNIWGGILWIFSAFMDRADGELARVAGKSSPWGHRFDCVTDMAITVLFFVAIGIGLRTASLGYWSLLLGLLAAAGVLAAQILAEIIDQKQQDSGAKAYPGFAGFDFDDILYLFPLIVWFDWHFLFLTGASVGAPAFALLTWYRLQQLVRQEQA